MSEQSTLKPALQIIVHFGLAGFAFFVGWWLWSWTRHEMWMFNIYAALFALGGVFRFGKGLFGLLMFMIERRKVARYRTKGTTPKDDPMARDADLRSRGLFK